MEKPERVLHMLLRTTLSWNRALFVWKALLLRLQRETSLSDSLDVVHARVLKLKEVTAATTSALAISVTTANISSISTISMADYDTPDAGVQDTAPHSPKIVFEKEDLETAPEHPSAIVCNLFEAVVCT
uniref:Uncharacterized protein n=1 Tax=Tanacetum cinerariifolium TaxID=118510 RepID=A0A699LGB1_TANCI|nr:hypothetical protein [Tanacetum cinerariifolium]